MLRPSMLNLKHIVMNICLFDDGNDSPFDIPSQFEEMCTENIIEAVTIAIQVRRIGSYRLLVGNSWGRLDEVLTSPGWFSLKWVSLAIDITRCNSRRLNGLKETLQKLPETQFPRLSSNNPVSFNFKIISK